MHVTINDCNKFHKYKLRQITEHVMSSNNSYGIFSVLQNNTIMVLIKGYLSSIYILDKNNHRKIK